MNRFQKSGVIPQSRHDTRIPSSSCLMCRAIIQCASTQVDSMIVVMIKVRRRLHPIEATQLVLMVLAIMTNACLQLRLR